MTYRPHAAIALLIALCCVTTAHPANADEPATGDPAPTGENPAAEGEPGPSGATAAPIPPAAAPPDDAVPPAAIELPAATVPRGLLPADWEDPASYGPSASAGGYAYVTRGYEGLAVLARASDGATRQLALIGQGLDVVGVRWVGDALLARTARGEALLLDVGEPAFPRVLLLVQPGARTGEAEGLARRSGTDVPLPPEPVAAEVVEIGRGVAIVDRGADDGLRPGMHLAITSTRADKVRDLATGRTVVRESGETLAVAPVLEVSPGRARVALGTGDDARVGDRAHSSGLPTTASTTTPGRVGEVIVVEGALRPFLGVNTLAFGMINDLRVTYRFRAPFRLTAALDPFAFAVGTDGSGLPGRAGVTAALDHAVFGFGLGAGYAWSLAKQTGVSIRQEVRFGPPDGVHFQGMNEFILALPTPEDFDGPARDEAAFIWGGARGQIRWPTGPRSRMAIVGGGAVNGYAFGLLDLHVAALGHGGPGTVWVRVGGGVGWLWDNPAKHSIPDVSEPSYEDAAGSRALLPPQVGPVFSVGVEWLAPMPRERR